jgi:hypothetical protein
MASIGEMRMERMEWGKTSCRSALWATVGPSAASAGLGFDAYGPPLASLLRSDGSHLDVREAAHRNTLEGTRTNDV